MNILFFQYFNLVLVIGFSTHKKKYLEEIHIQAKHS